MAASESSARRAEEEETDSELRPASPSQRWAEPKPLGKHQPPPVRERMCFTSIRADLSGIADKCCCVSDAVAGEQTQEFDEASAAAAVVRSY